MRDISLNLATPHELDSEGFEVSVASSSASRASPSPGGDPGEAGSKPSASFTETSLELLHVNMRGFVSKSALLELHLQELGLPAVVGLTETFLDQARQSISLTHYSLVSRRDRVGGSGGGIALFVRSDCFNSIVHLADSETHERCWVFAAYGSWPFRSVPLVQTPKIQ